jgi:hypothetical protein
MTETKMALMISACWNRRPGPLTVTAEGLI